jgi:hypothetical protein
MVACDAATGMFEDSPVPSRVGTRMGFCPSTAGCAGGGAGAGTGLDVLAGGGVTGLEGTVPGLLMVLVELLVPVGPDLSYGRVRGVNSKIQRNVKTHDKDQVFLRLDVICVNGLVILQRSALMTKGLLMNSEWRKRE